MEPMFKRLTDEIRTLQSSLSVHDQFSKEAAACYQQVLLHLLMDQEASRVEQDSRIERLDKELYGNLNWIVMLSRFLDAIPYLISSLVGLVMRIPIFEF